MGLFTATQERAWAPQHLVPSGPAESRWNLAFLGILGYLVVEYTRLPAMFPVLIPLELGKVVIVASLLGWLLSPRLRTVVSSEVRRIDVTLLLFLLASFLSCLFARYQDPAWGYFVGLLGSGLVYFLIGRVVTSLWRIRVFVGVFLLLNLKMAEFVIRSYFGMRHSGVDPVQIAAGVGAGSTGFFSNSNDFGAAMCVAWPLASLLLFSNLKKPYKAALLMISATMLAAIVLCSSRGTLVGAGAIVLAAIFRQPRKLVASLMLASLVAGVLLIMPKAHMQRALSGVHYEQDLDAQSRLGFWRVGLKMFQAHPVLGVGVGNFPSMYREDYETTFDKGKVRAAHSLYIQALSELGVAGTLPAVLLWLFLALLNAVTRREIKASSLPGRRSFEYCLALGLDLALVGYLATGAFLSTLYYPHMWVLLGLGAGLRTACARIPSGEAERECEEQKGDPLPPVLSRR